MKHTKGMCHTVFEFANGNTVQVCGRGKGNGHTRPRSALLPHEFHAMNHLAHGSSLESESLSLGSVLVVSGVLVWAGSA